MNLIEKYGSHGKHTLEDGNVLYWAVNETGVDFDFHTERPDPGLTDQIFRQLGVPEQPVNHTGKLCDHRGDTYLITQWFPEECYIVRHMQDETKVPSREVRNIRDAEDADEIKSVLRGR